MDDTLSDHLSEHQSMRGRLMLPFVNLGDRRSGLGFGAVGVAGGGVRW